MGMGFGGMGWGSGAGGWLGMAPMALLWIFLIAGLVLLAKWLFGAAADARRTGSGGAREILAERYARGEIDREEFEKRRRDLSA